MPVYFDLEVIGYRMRLVEHDHFGLRTIKRDFLAKSQLYRNLRSRFNCLCSLCGDLEMLSRLVSSAK